MVAYTITDHEDFLRTRSKEVDLETEDCKEDIELLEEYCLSHEVLAMAAVQIGIGKRIIYLKNTDLENIEDTEHNERRILINPVITKREGLTEYWEACASCLTNTGRVLRPYKIELEYIDEFGNNKKSTFKGFEATVLSHEYDHLDGILHIDIAEEVLQMEKEERKEFRKEHGYKIFSEIGAYQKLLENKRKRELILFLFSTTFWLEYGILNMDGDTMKENFEKYADLLLIRCLNLKERVRPLLISAPIKAIDFIQVLTHRAYELGITDIYFDWEDNVLKREQLLHLEKDDLLASSFWNKQIFDEYAKKDAAFLMLYSDAPELMKDIPSEKISWTSHQFRASRPYYKKRQSTDDVPWCISIVATEEYAKQVFPDKENALELTWDAIFKCCLVYEEDPVEAWNEKVKLSRRKSELLNQYRFRYLHYENSLGTDLKIELPKNHKWCGAGDGPLIVNMPTEEVFTTPLRTGVNGTIYSARPLVYGGSLIENFSFRLEDGKIVEINAEKGKEILENMVATDNNSCYLGEVALVDYDSPISNMNIIFYETLYDENASCHLAIGDGFPKCYENGENMTREELVEVGVNHSTVHTDFMVGTSDLKITGTTWDGEEFVVFENGNFVLEG